MNVIPAGSAIFEPGPADEAERTAWRSQQTWVCREADQERVEADDSPVEYDERGRKVKYDIAGLEPVSTTIYYDGVKRRYLNAKGQYCDEFAHMCARARSGSHMQVHTGDDRQKRQEITRAPATNQ